MPRVGGSIRFSGLARPLRGVTLRVRVEETGRADAPAVRLAEQVLAGVDVAPGDPPVRFELPEVVAPVRGHCTLRVVADVDGDGAVGRGDWVTRRSHPVLRSGQADEVDVTLYEIP